MRFWKRRTVPLLVSSLAVAGALAVGGTATAKATPPPPPAPIGPNQHFVGLVNGHSANAVILMVCTPPLDPAQTGHPLGGQTIQVSPPATTARSTGDTGSRGHSVVASIVFPTATSAGTTTLTFTHYGSQQIPTTDTLPCGGSGKVVFAPQPTSKTAHSYTVSVTFGNITTDPPG